jgi:autotransporter passenger strand-loop-strand repeat protein
MSDTTIGHGISSGGLTVDDGDNLYVYGSAVSTTVSGGGSATIFAGGTASYTTVSSGGTETISSGGAASFTTISADGAEIVLSSGVTISDTVMRAGSETISAGGIASFTTVSFGGFDFVSSGGAAVSTTVSTNGTEYVYRGGVASFTTVSAGGEQRVSGGLTSFTTVSIGGVEYVFSGGSAVSTTVSSYASDYVFSGGTATGTIVQTGADEYVYSSGTTSFTTVSGTGKQYVSSGATATGTTVSLGGSQYVYSSGITVSTLLTGGGSEIVYAGGSAISTTADGGGGLNQYGLIVDGTATGTTLNSGGYEGVKGSGTSLDTVVNSGSYEIISSGGTATSTTVRSGGHDEVRYSGSAVSTIVSSGGYETVDSNGTASFTAISRGGYQLVSGVASDTVLHEGGTQSVSSGGSAVSTTVQSGGVVFVYSGGTATSIAVDSGGAEFVFSGGSATDTVVEPGGDLIVLPGGITDGTTGTVVSTVALYTPSSGVRVYPSVASGSTVSSGGTEYVLSSGSTLSTTVLSGGSEIVFSGGTTTSTIVSSGGSENISVGGIASFTTVSSGGFLNVSSGGSAASTTAASDGTEYIYAGGTASFTQVDGGTEDVAGSSLSTTVREGDQYVFGGAVASDATISGGYQFVGTGGSAVSTTVDSGGSQQAQGGGRTSFTIINSGGFEAVAAGATAVSTTINAGGYATVSGIASDTKVNSHGAEFVYSRGVASDTVVRSGAALFVFSSGSASGTTLDAGGYLIVVPGGTQTGTTGPGTIVTTGVVLYQTDSGTTVYPVSVLDNSIGSGVDEYVLPHGSAIGTTLSSGGSLFVYSGGTASLTTISSGSAESVFSGGKTTRTTISSGGNEYVYSGGSTTSATVDAGGAENVGFSGTIIDTTVSSGGADDIGSSGTASATAVDSGGTEFVYSGGLAISAQVKNGGFEVVSSAGVVSNATVSSGGLLFVYSGGSAVSTTLDHGGYLVVLPGGYQSGTVPTSAIVSSGVLLDQPGTGITVYPVSSVDSILLSGAFEYALPDGKTISTTVSNGGEEDVFSGATASFTTVSNGGNEYVYSAGLTVSTTAASGGIIEITFSGSATDTTVKSGGQMQVDDSAIDSFTTVQGGGADYAYYAGLAVSTTVDSGGLLVIEYGGSGTETALDIGGGLDIAYISYDSVSTTLSVTSTGELTLHTPVVEYTTQLAGNYADEYFRLSADAQNEGTLITAEGTPCYCRGTLILTDRGEAAVEDLRIGDRLVTRSGIARPLRWIGRRSYSGRFAAGNRDVLPVLIRRDALADGVPRRDLMVSPLHAMYLDGVLIPAASLVNGRSIVQIESVDKVEYFHLELDTHDVILAEGAASETFVDDGSRGMFHNAAEYRLLYPDAVNAPVRFCAPRVEDGEALEVARRRLAARAEGKRRRRKPSAGKLQGYLDTVTHGVIEGWARDGAAPDRPVRLRILDNDVALGETVADCYRADLAIQRIGHGHHAFAFSIPGGLSPLVRHVIRVVRAADGHELTNSPWVLDAAPLTLTPTRDSGATLRGRLDLVVRDRIYGWAQDAADPQTRVALQILDNAMPIARVVANVARADLAAAGIGDGRHAFDIIIPGGLSPLARHVIRVTRESDGAELPGSPAVIEAAGAFDADLQQAVARAVASLGPDDDRQRVLSFILAQAERLREIHADTEAHRTAQLAHRRMNRRAGPDAAALQAPVRRALVLDTHVPAAGHDGGSAALLSHMRALQALGYAVSFSAADAMAQDGAARSALEAMGVTCCGAPFYVSVEDVLRRHAGCVDVVYLHRAGIATRYLGLARRYMPSARILYSVADLHHVRLERQAAVEERPDLLAVSRRQRLEECVAAWSADAVLTHSIDEATALRRLVPEASVHHVPWAVPARAVPTDFAQRQGIAFIGGYAHAPNVDAARWLVEAVMPLVWRDEPTIECLLVGSDMPDSVRGLAQPGVVAVGAVADLNAILDQVRLTVAPLRFGAGVKGKVLDSMAAGVPCVMTPIAAEGLALPASLRALIGSQPAEIAALIRRLYCDSSAHRDAARDGQALIRGDHSDSVVLAALRAAIEGRAHAQSDARAG